MFVFSSHTRPAHSETSPAALTTPALDRRSLRWFGISACTATPQDLPPSLAQHGSCRRSSTSSSSLPFRTHGEWREGTSPLPALLEPYVTVSRHTAPTVRRSSASVDLSDPPPKGRPPNDLELPDPFAPTPLQGPHRYYEPVRPCAPHRYSRTRSVCCLRFSPSRPATPAVSIGATGSPVPCQRLRRAHATHTPDTAGATYRQLPD